MAGRKKGNPGMSDYPTRRDWWLMAILWSLAGFCTFIAFTVHNEPAAPWMKVFATCFFAVFSVLTIALAILPYFTSYSLDPVNLTIIVGPFRTEIAIEGITEVFPTKNPLSAPAWSGRATWPQSVCWWGFSGGRHMCSWHPACGLRQG